MLRKAISRTSGYVSAMTNLGVTLQANHKVNSNNHFLSSFPMKAKDPKVHYLQDQKYVHILSIEHFGMYQLDEAEFWYREALRLASPEERDACLFNLALMMRAGDEDRLEEAINLIVRCAVLLQSLHPDVTADGSILRA